VSSPPPPPRGIFLGYLHNMHSHGGNIAATWALRQMVGAEAFTRLCASGVEPEHLEKLTDVVLNRVLGLTKPDPKAPSDPTVMEGLSMSDEPES
jgi:hypothetical protein